MQQASLTKCNASQKKWNWETQMKSPIQMKFKILSGDSRQWHKLQNQAKFLCVVVQFWNSSTQISLLSKTPKFVANIFLLIFFLKIDHWNSHDFIWPKTRSHRELCCLMNSLTFLCSMVSGWITHLFLWPNWINFGFYFRKTLGTEYLEQTIQVTFDELELILYWNSLLNYV